MCCLFKLKIHTNTENKKMIELQKNEIPVPGANPAAGMIKDTLDYHGATQVEVAKAMRISPSVLCDILKGRKGVSADFALRFERCLGISAQWLLDLQNQHDFSKAYHGKIEKIEREVTVLDYKEAS